MPSRILVSACLLGAPVRYNGTAKTVESDIVGRWEAQGRIVPVCPEVSGGLGTPRPPAETTGGDGVLVLRGAARVLTDGGADVTEAFVAGARHAVALARAHGISVAVLKSLSPSCGTGWIYDGTFSGTRVPGFGVAAAALRDAGVRVFDETQLAEADAALAALDSKSEGAMQKDTLQSLFTHMEWADAGTWKAASALRDARRDTRLLQLLYHLHTVQWVYLQLWRSQPFDIPPEGSFADLGAIRRWARPYYAESRALLRDASEEALARPLAIPWTEEIVKRYGSAGDVTFAETMMQVVLHSTYHRAQAATRIRELGGEPSVTDFVAWLWQNRPAPRWADGGDTTDD